MMDRIEAWMRRDAARLRSVRAWGVLAIIVAVIFVSPAAVRANDAILGAVAFGMAFGGLGLIAWAQVQLGVVRDEKEREQG
jgi:hypothetical protein